MFKILIVYHSQSGNTKAAAEAVARGAKRVAGTEVIVKKALEADLSDLLSSRLRRFLWISLVESAFLAFKRGFFLKGALSCLIILLG